MYLELKFVESCTIFEHVTSLGWSFEVFIERVGITVSGWWLCDEYSKVCFQRICIVVDDVPDNKDDEEEEEEEEDEKDEHQKHILDHQVGE